MFKGRDLFIITKHEKEKVIAPIMEKELGVKCYVDKNYDTDILGTFSGEIERKDDPITTVRNKCIDAMKKSGYDLAIASEGSFGSHPTIFFGSANEEFLIFIDTINELEIIVRELSTSTNFNAEKIDSLNTLFEFSQRVEFPSHGLILRPSINDYSIIIKGITVKEKLISSFNELISNFESVYVETDMRAMFNPSRMKVIENAALKLAEKINCLCPKCSTPGFSITAAKKGLPCEICSFPTNSTLSYIYSCQKCDFSKEEKHPNGKKTEEPMYCDICNP